MIAKLAAAIGLVLVVVLVSAAWISVPRERPIASFGTSLQGRSLSQRHNALLALRGIDQKVLPPNATFSFNSAVGSYSRDQGYRKAPVSYNGQLIDDWGGGVCQTSTTLYNAALLAGLTILERNHHRFCPSYVTPGRDAAVAYPSLDLRFQNPYPFPVRIHAQIERDMLQVELLASRPLPEPVSLNTRLSQRTRPATFVTGRAAGTHFLRNSGKAGYDTCVYRTVGKHEELISVDSYPVMNRLVEYR